MSTMKPLRRALALLLCAQPVFWMSSVALAQIGDTPSTLQLGSPGQPSASPLEDRGAEPGAAAGGTSAAPAEFEAPRSAQAPGTLVHGGPVSTAPSAPPIDEPVDPGRYVLAHGDVLELNFWGLQSFTLRVMVDVEGRVFVPKVGYFDVEGKTLTETRRAMTQSVSRYYRLRFGVSLAEPRTFLVQVVDDVVRPGSYPARATERVATVIARAGGFGKNASQRRIEIRRRDGSRIRVDLLRYAQTGDVKYNPRLLDGDAVRVPFEELTANVEGAVNRPGRYELIGTRDLAELIEVAGGLAPRATKLLPITILRRASGDRREQQTFEFGPQGALPVLEIRNEDTIRVPSFLELQQAVIVVGAFVGARVPTVAAAAVSSGSGATPGLRNPDEVSSTLRLPFVQGETVNGLVQRVGGVGPLADLMNAYILREGRLVPVDLYRIVMLRDLAADRPIELGDTLVIPFMRRNILVEGAVFAPGAYPYNPSFGVEQYLSLAGGRNRFARDISDVRLVTPRGEMKQYSSGVVVEPGSSIVVPERDFSRTELVQILLGAAGIVLSGVAVVIAARK